ncbi:MAG: hypothetical protein HC915_04090 [Anaerolineae bacterium]|nr:hypothetical protein [Anaerolineae bacterium]
MLTLEGHADQVNVAAFTPDGRYAVTASGLTRAQQTPVEVSVRFWDLETGAEVQRVEGHTGGITAVSFSDDAASWRRGPPRRTARCVFGTWNAKTTPTRPKMSCKSSSETRWGG